jgi:hypothetical protein
MTVYTVLGHPLGPPPDPTSMILDDDLLNALKTAGIGQTITLTLPADVATDATSLDLIQ